MASDLLTLLSQQTPSLQTRKGLLVVGLQNDLLPGGKLPVTLPSDYFDKLRTLVSAFRDHGDVIWVRSEYEADRQLNLDEASGDIVVLENVEQAAQVEEPEHGGNDNGDGHGDSPVPLKRARVSLDEVDHTMPVNQENASPDVSYTTVDEELFLTRTDQKEACCITGSFGAQHPSQIANIIDTSKDLHVRSTKYSAFGSTSLLFTLRSKLITELYICGGPTNLTVCATSMDAATHGLPVTLVDDCLLARNQERHESAMMRLSEDIEADIMTSDQVIKHLNSPQSRGEDPSYGNPYEDVRIEDIVVEDETDVVQLEIDSNDGGEDSLPEAATSRPASSPVHDNLMQLRSYNAMKQAAKRLESASTEEDSLFSGLANGVSYHKSADDHPLPVNIEAEITPRIESGEKLAESAPLTTKLGNSEKVSDGLSGRVDIEDWLETTRPPAKKSVSSKHPGLQALSSLAGLDQRTVDSYEEMMSEAKEARKTNDQPLFGPDRARESAGSSILFDLLSVELAETIFEQLKGEISWERMFHQMGEVPRLVCCQGTIAEDGSRPVYRHPSDQTLPVRSWTPNVNVVRKRAEEIVGHALNHCLIQLYRGGTDFISEHSDKTLDVAKSSYIVNVSFGAQRTMRLRTKRAAAMGVDGEPSMRVTHRVPMPHNSMIKMSLETNAEYLHGINADKRPAVELSESETAFEGQRISLTFRNIGTFLDHDSSHIWGQGATSKEKSNARPVINADTAESDRLIRAFGTENQGSTIQWDEIYGNGFDVLHLK